MRQFEEDSNVIKLLVTIGDFFILLFTTIVLYLFFINNYPIFLPQITFSEHVLVSILCYFAAVTAFGTIVHRRIVAPEKIVTQVMLAVATHFILNVITIDVLFRGVRAYRYFAVFYTLFFILLALWRMSCRLVIIAYRKKGGNSRTAVFVGAYSNVEELYDQMALNSNSGYRVLGEIGRAHV